MSPDKRGEVVGRETDGIPDADVGKDAVVAERVHGRHADAEAARSFAHGQKGVANVVGRLGHADRGRTL